MLNKRPSAAHSKGGARHAACDELSGIEAEFRENRRRVLTGPARGRGQRARGASEPRNGSGLHDAGVLDVGLACPQMGMAGGILEWRRNGEAGVTAFEAPAP